MLNKILFNSKIDITSLNFPVHAEQNLNQELALVSEFAASAAGEGLSVNTC